MALPNGCLCCHLRGDLEETLIGAAMRRRRGDIAGFDRVIVETSGLADPGPVAQTLYADAALARDFKLGPIVDRGRCLRSPSPGKPPPTSRGRRSWRRTSSCCRRSIAPAIPRAHEVGSAELNPAASTAFARNSARSTRMPSCEATPASDHVPISSPVHNSAIRSFALRFDAAGAARAAAAFPLDAGRPARRRPAASEGHRAGGGRAWSWCRVCGTSSTASGRWRPASRRWSSSPTASRSAKSRRSGRP